MELRLPGPESQCPRLSNNDHDSTNFVPGRQNPDDRHTTFDWNRRATNSASVLPPDPPFRTREESEFRNAVTGRRSYRCFNEKYPDQILQGLPFGENELALVQLRRTDVLDGRKRRLPGAHPHEFLTVG